MKCNLMRDPIEIKGMHDAAKNSKAIDLQSLRILKNAMRKNFTLFQYGDNGPRRFGFREMSETDKNSVEFYVLTDADKLKIINRLANTEMSF